jgi:hypothetical protein
MLHSSNLQDVSVATERAMKDPEAPSGLRACALKAIAKPGKRSRSRAREIMQTSLISDSAEVRGAAAATIVAHPNLVGGENTLSLLEGALAKHPDDEVLLETVFDLVAPKWRWHNTSYLRRTALLKTGPWRSFLINVPAFMPYASAVGLPYRLAAHNLYAWLETISEYMKVESDDEEY